MRIITGTLKSRLFKSPPGNRTHPMSEKARAAIFNVLGNIEGFSVLDGFGGSGSLVFEAVSRGASQAIVIDQDKRAYKTLKENIESLNIVEQVTATRANSVTWCKNNQDQYFDLVFADPPYNDVNPLYIQALAERTSVGGIFVLSHPDDYRSRLDKKEWKLLSSKRYAGANIAIFKRLR